MAVAKEFPPLGTTVADLAAQRRATEHLKRKAEKKSKRSHREAERQAMQEAWQSAFRERQRVERLAVIEQNRLEDMRKSEEIQELKKALNESKKQAEWTKERSLREQETAQLR